MIRGRPELTEMRHFCIDQSALKKLLDARKLTLDLVALVDSVKKRCPTTSVVVK